MPSPFPGMDPYLENPARWPDVHHEIISNARVALNLRLRPKYQVRIEERVYISDDLDLGRPMIVPELFVVSTGAARTAADVAEITVDLGEPIVTDTLIETEIHEARLEIVDSEDQSVVTVIEVLSPSNKVSGSAGWESFVEKRREVSRSTSHWVEIDLLRAGRSLEIRKRIRPHEYMVHIARAGRRPKGLLWPIRLSGRLPVVPIPLRHDDEDVPLDLQSVLDVSYDRAGYDLAIDYRKDPIAPLEGEWSAWADRLLKEKGLRPGSD